jgi:xylan 1,4-beta-xylosidase
MNPIWSFGGNTCHAPLWLRDDLCRHLERVRDDLGFSYIRAHGPLGDGNGVVGADGRFDFSRLLKGLDRLLERKLTPFLELSHMPDALARGDKSLAKYRFRSDPPADWNRWYQLIEALMDQLLKRYGIQQLRTWYFEVWNEPDISFWTGTQEEYFKLYDLAARAVKQCDRQLRIGGPATARTNWIDEFLEHVNKPSADFGLDGSRCDFVSTHAYPSDLEFLDAAEGEVELQNSNVMRELFTAVRRKVDKALGEGFPVICGEWNSSAGPLAANHDDCNNGAFIAKTMVELSELCQGSLVWNISDIYEECGFHYEPFHGGYGLLTVNDLPKAAFHAFALLHEHDQAERLEVQLNNAPEGVGALASCDDQQVRLLLYYYCEPGNESPTAVNVQLQGLPESRAQRVGVAPGQGSAYETWVELGRPSYVNRHVLDRLEAASQPKRDTIDASGPIRLEPGTMMQLTWPV